MKLLVVIGLLFAIDGWLIFPMFLSGFNNDIYISSELDVACWLSMELDPWWRWKDAFGRCQPDSRTSWAFLQRWSRHSFPAFHEIESNCCSTYHMDGKLG